MSAAIVVPLAALTKAPLPVSDPSGSVAASAHDEAALDDLARMVRSGAEGSWLVEYTVRREAAGREPYESSVVAASAPPSRIVTDGETLTATIGARSFACTLTENGSTCSEAAPSSVEPGGAGALLDAATGGERYAVTRADPRVVAGERTECFRFAAPAYVAPAFPREAEYCYAPDGLLLAASVERAGETDTRTATRVERGIGSTDLLELLDPFDAGEPTGPG